MTDIQMELDFGVLLNVVDNWTSKWTCGHREFSSLWKLLYPAERSRSRKCEAALSSWSILQSILRPSSRRRPGLAYNMFAIFFCQL